MSTVTPPVNRRRLLPWLRVPRGSVLFAIAIAVMGCFAFVAALGSKLAPYPPGYGDLTAPLEGIGPTHWLGTDQAGHDVLSMLLEGARTSFVGAVGVVVFSTVLGLIVGLVAGWSNGWLDGVINRILDILFAFPGLLLAILSVALFGKGLTAPMLAMAVAYTPYTARLVRGMVKQEKARAYVPAYVVQGYSPLFVASRRVMPNIAPTVLAQSAVNFGYALLDLAALSFLGFGVQPPESDWGSMINQGQTALLAGAPLSAIVPAVAIVIVVVAFNIVGEDISDRLQGKDARVAA
jgi:peptide/nickel transport system permease protein